MDSNFWRHSYIKLKITVLVILSFIVIGNASLMLANTNKASEIDNKPNLVQLLQADSLGFNAHIHPEAQILRGNVVFLHDSTFMYCDSAYLFQHSNSLEAFDNVRMEQGDTLFVYGDYLRYDGNTALAKLRENVKMENGNVSLFTDSLNFDRVLNIGYFFEGGMLVDEENELTSIYGQYSPDTKMAFFNRDVKLINSQFTLTSDTLEYATISKIATILGPSVIVSDSATIHSSRGWYNTQSHLSMLYDRSTIFSKDNTKSLTGDSIFYDKARSFGEAFGNMLLVDTVKKVNLMGEYGYYYETTGEALATDSALMVEYSQGDSLFLHADTLKMINIGEGEREITAHYGVRFFRADLQGVCDSLQFNTADTVLYLYKDPILWNTGYQVSGDTIHIFFNDSTVDRAEVIDFAFATEKVDSSYFNQLKGKIMHIYFQESQLHQIYVNGNAETIFYPSEEGGSFIGMNKTESSYFRINFKDSKIEKMVLWPQAKGTTIPLPDLNPEIKFLKGFIDYDYLRPKDRDDVFSKTARKTEDIEARPKSRRSRN
ncbi:hypothetical protein AwDysgo_09850 [Bacteroidales bacterium]|nr:hypothetical protein AwDysgo_09850 [Bacteroidales bacterium]